MLAIYSESNCTALQDDHNKLIEWAHIWLIEFNVNKCEHLRITDKQCPIIYSYILENFAVTEVPHSTLESPLTRSYHGTNEHTHTHTHTHTHKESL